MNNDMKHMDFISVVANRDVSTLQNKEATYQGSWKRAGGRSAWFMARRNMDRLITMLAAPKEPVSFNLTNVDDTIEAVNDAEGGSLRGKHVRFPGTREATVAMLKYLRDSYVAEDIFRAIEADPSGNDGTVLACVRDLRCYFMLIEAEMMSRGVVPSGVIKIQLSELSEESVGAAFTGEEAAKIFKDHVIGRTSSECDRFVDAKNKRWSDMTMPELEYAKQILMDDNAKATGWGAAVGARNESIKEIDAEMTLRNHVALVNKPRTPEDGGHHASLVPYVVSGVSDYFSTSGLGATFRDVFWREIGKGDASMFVLEPHVVSEHIPRALRNAYHYQGDTKSWVIDIDRVPPDAREYFPQLCREQNAVELEELQPWMRRMYVRDEKANKYVLRNDNWSTK